VGEHEGLLDAIGKPGSLSVQFQPVLDVRGLRIRTHYLEALVRGPRGTALEPPAILFDHARKQNQEAAVDRACLEAIFAAASVFPPEAMLGVNVHASSLARDEGLVDFLAAQLARRQLSARRLIVEIVEHAPPWDVVTFRTALKRLRGLGARIALDDVGLGQSNYMMVVECLPDYLKVDRYFVAGCHRDFHRKAVLASIAHLARPFGARVVAEGVEQVADLVVLKRLGISLVQGFLFGGPAPAAELVSCPRRAEREARGERRRARR
jgi:EAL domain-containing protein (putative c-di-GMP-specific phosphodiesterase class I)